MHDVKDNDGNLNDEDEDALIPGTAFTHRQAKLLQRVVIIMGIMLVAGFALLIGIIAYRASQPAKPQPPIAPAGVGVPGSGAQLMAPLAPSTPRRFETLMPKGTTYLASTINGNRLILTLQTRDKNLKLLLIDLNRWQVAGDALIRQDRD